MCLFTVLLLLLFLLLFRDYKQSSIPPCIYSIAINITITMQYLGIINRAVFLHISVLLLLYYYYNYYYYLGITNRAVFLHVSIPGQEIGAQVILLLHPWNNFYFDTTIFMNWIYCFHYKLPEFSIFEREKH